MRKPTAAQRTLDAAELLGTYRVLTFDRLAAEAFGGDAFAANRALRGLVNRGLAESRRSAAGKYGYEIFALTKEGADWLGRGKKKRRRAGRTSDPDQAAAYGFGDLRQVLHDQRVFEAVSVDTAPDLAAGARIKRVRLDGEVRGFLAGASESARVSGGDGDARAARRTAAYSIGLSAGPGGGVAIPDALVEIEHADGRVETRGIEVGSSQYTGKQVQAKVAAGFRFYMPAKGGGSVRSQPAAAFPVDWAAGGR